MDGNADSESKPEPATPLYVLIPPSPLFAAHWSFFIPNLLDYDAISRRHEESTIGRRIHVSGDRLNGFRLEIVRQYDVSKHRSVGSRRYLVALIPAKHLQASASESLPPAERFKQKDDDEGGGYIDNDAIDDFERICVEVEAPGPSLNRVSQTASSVPTKKAKAEVKDCQWWVRQVVDALMTRGMLEPAPTSANKPASQSPSDAVAALPVH